MSLVPVDWHDPGSRAGLYYELGWMLAGLVVVVGLFVIDPAVLDLSPQPVVPPTVAGGLLGVAAVYASAEFSLVQRIESSFWIPFAAIFLGVFVVKPLRRAPTLTLLVTLGAILAAIPTRLLVYRRHRRDDGGA